MTRKAMLLVTGFTVALAAAAYAATGEGYGPGMRGGMHGMGMHGFGMHGKGMEGGMHGMGLKALDTDKDGDVTLAEFLKPSETRFAELDKDNGGFLDAAKLTAAFKARSDEHVDRMMKRLDRDGDGKVSLAEFIDGGRGHKGWGMGRHGHRGMRMGAGPGPDGMGGMKGGMGGMAQGGPGGAAAADETGAETGGPGPRRGWHGRHHGRFAGGMGSTESRIERFKAMDKNNDGFVDKAEMQAAQADDIAYRVKRMLHSLDTNKDGRITKDEFLAPAKQHFARMDLNDDGKITADDMPPHMRLRWASK